MARRPAVMGGGTDARRLRTLVTALRVAKALARRPAPLSDVAREVGVSQRTARRAVYALRRAGIDVESVSRHLGGHQTFYGLDRRAWLGSIDTPPE